MHSAWNISDHSFSRNCELSDKICGFAAEMSRAVEFRFFHASGPISANTLQNKCIYLAVQYQQLA